MPHVKLKFCPDLVGPAAHILYHGKTTVYISYLKRLGTCLYVYRQARHLPLTRQTLAAVAGPGSPDLQCTRLSMLDG